MMLIRLAAVCVLAFIVDIPEVDSLTNSYNSFNITETNIFKKCIFSSKKIIINEQNEGKVYQGYVFSMKIKNSVDVCFKLCCHHPQCNTILHSNYNCYGYSDFELAKELPSSKEFHDESEVTGMSDVKRQYSYLKRVRKKRSPQTKEPFIPTRCTDGLLNCKENEFCFTTNNRRKSGICQCNKNYKRNDEGICILSDSNETETSVNPLHTTLPSNIHKTLPATLESTFDNASMDTGTSTKFSTSENLKQITESTLKPTTKEVPEVKPITKLVVNISNKTINLPEGFTRYKDWVTLSAYALGDTGSKYKFNWNLVDKPNSKEEGSIRDMNSQTISLSDLVAGVYIFKVTVNGTNSYGEATGNVTVLPAKHLNKAPVAVIVPSSQTIKLPNSGVILDGSGSSDDKKIVSLHWELVMGPLGYKLKEETGPTLQMTDLVPGNYTVMLKLKDEEGLEGNTTASVMIVKETDYPPTANAGGDKIIYMPQTEIVLNGNQSTDDHEISQWEWTKGPEDSGNAVDMQDTRTPYLHLSTLEEGHYHFILKVLDSAGQDSNSSSHVYVHSSSDNILKANAGPDVTLVIPNTTASLDGSLSTGLSSQTEFLWRQISGPSPPHFSSPSNVSTNASSLTRGKYTFQLCLWNAERKQHNSTSNVTVTVIQDKNAAPLANAGGDFSITLPVSVVIVNGSLSSDDVGIVEWHWHRDATSLAAGTIIKNSDKTPVLLFTNVVPGRYVWNLTVWDDQGAQATDTVSIIVKEGPNYLDEVEIVIGVSIEHLSASQLSNLLQKLQLLLHNSTSDITFTLLDIRGRPLSGIVSLVVLGNRNGKVIRGSALVAELKGKTVANYRDRILNLPLISVDTVICQNNCSGHGECIQSTRECRCQSWWMESVWKRHFGEATPNCDWSVVYVFVGALGTAVSIGALVWTLHRLILRKCKTFGHRKAKTSQYSLLDAYEDNNAKLPTKLQTSLLDSGTDTDSETEVVFESRTSKQRNDKHKNGLIKLQRIRS